MKIINIDGEIGWEIDVKDVRKQLSDANGEDITVNIASPGGLVSEGIKIFNELKNYPGKVYTHLTGFVASMATYIAMAGEKRTAETNATFMIHNTTMFVGGDHRSMFKAGNHLNAISNITAKELSKKSDTPLSDIRSSMDETTFYYGDEIKEAGFVHEMVGDPEPEGKQEALAVAQTLYEDCNKKMNDPGVVEKEIKSLAVMMAKKPEENNTGKPENQKEVTKMTLKELKEKHPDVYNKIMELGRAEGVETGMNSERSRVKELTEMRGKFKKPHSQAVIDAAITEGHEMAQVSVNLMAADQAAAELDESDNPDGTQNAGSDTPEMKGEIMTHDDHIEAQAKELEEILG